MSRISLKVIMGILIVGLTLSCHRGGGEVDCAEDAVHPPGDATRCVPDSRPRSVTVPDLTGASEIDAKNSAETVGLSPYLERPSECPPLARLVVINQAPSPDTMVRPGATLRLEMSCPDSENSPES